MANGAGRHHRPDPGGEPSGFELGEAPTLEFLRAVGGAIGEAVTVVDGSDRVLVWNAAAEQLYGIAASEAIGQPYHGLLGSTIVGRDGESDDEPWRIAATNGVWRGRTVDVPKVGSRTGESFIVEVVLSPVRDAAGQPAGVLCVKREISAIVRLERDLAALESLASATSGAAPAGELADQAIGVLMDATEAALGAILTIDGDRTTMLAGRGLVGDLADLYAAVSPSSAPLFRSLRGRGTVTSVDVREAGLMPVVAEHLSAIGIRSIAAVGLYRGLEFGGVLLLGWDDITTERPASATILQAGAHVERLLADAALVAAVAEQAAGDRALASRLESLGELTLVGDASTDLAELARRTVGLVRDALGASGAAYELVVDESTPISVTVGFPDAIEAWLADHPVAERGGWSAWTAGAPSVIGPIDDRLPAPVAGAARASGISSFATIPITLEGRTVGGVVALFGRSTALLGLHRSGLDAVARVVSISLANHRLRQRVVASELRYRTLFEHSPQAMLLIDAADQTIVAANAAATALFARPMPDLVGQPIAAIGDVEPDWVASMADQVVRTGQASFERRAIRPDGSTFLGGVDAAVLEVAGRPHIIALVRDLTDSERLQSELVQAQKMEALSQLVSGVAHELNNPLTSIVAFGQYLQGSADLPDELRDDAAIVVEEADRTRRIVRNLLDFARQRPPERTAVKIRSLVQAAIDLQAYELQVSGISLDVDLPDDLPALELDRSQITQVLLNLTLNAIQATRSMPGRGGSIRISGERIESSGGPVVRLTVADDGPGVAPAHRDRLFVPFFTTKAPGEGTGLALSVSFGIAAAHGGRLYYEPQPTGSGARFILELPIAERAAGAGLRGEPAGADERAPRAGLRVLVLDDEPAIRRLIEKALTTAGATPVLAASGAAAVELVRESAFDVMLCDHRMAGMDGIEVYEAVTALRPELGEHFVFMSGDIMNPSLSAFTVEHETRMLEKPFTIEQLVAAVTVAAG